MNFSHLLTDFILIGLVLPVANFFNISTDGQKASQKIIEKQVKTGVVSFEIAPDFAKLKIDGKVYDSWQHIELTPEKHKVEASAEDYFSYKGTIRVASEDTLVQKISLKPNFGYLAMRIEPPDATVKVNGKTYREVDKIKLPLGKSIVKISRESYVSKAVSVEISPKKTDSLSIELDKITETKPRFGSLLFRANSTDAKIVLKRDGVTIKEWQGNALTENLLAGEYELVAKADGFSSFTRHISIEKNRRSIEYLRMNSIRYSKQNYSVRELKSKIAYCKRQKYFMLAISLVGFAVAEGMHLLANEEYYKYKKAKSPSDCTYYRSNYCLYNNIASVTAVVHFVPFGTFSYYRYKQHYYEELLREKM